jgi:hypothetical protein
MTHNIILKEQRAQLVVKEMNNGTKIISEPDQDGWVRLEVVIEGTFDILSLYHAGMSACRQMEKEVSEATSKLV